MSSSIQKKKQHSTESSLLVGIFTGVFQGLFWWLLPSGSLLTWVWKSIGAAFFPFELVVLGVSCPSGTEAHQLRCDVGKTPLQTSGALLPKVTVSVAGVWWTRVLLHQRNNDLFSHVRQQRECRIDYEVYETNLGLGYQGAFSIAQRREGEAELRLSITLTMIEREREDILKGIPHAALK